MRLAIGRGLGAVRLDALLLDVSSDIRPGFGETIYLRARTRPWRTAPRRARVVLWLVIPLVWLARILLRKRHGYTGGPLRAPNGGRAGIQWDIRGQVARTAWWRRGRGAALGTIRWQPYTDPAEPWERILAASLSPEAAGRIEWIRLASGIKAYEAHAAESVLLAPAAWDRALRQQYAPPGGASAFTGLRHVIGRAVASSAGPVMDCGGGANADATGAGPDQQWLLGVRELRRGQPAIVILQAEPAPGDTAGPEPPDDQAEKLRLGAELAGDGVPAVLLLPVLPAGIAADLAQVITTHLDGRPGGDAQVLLTRLRAAITPHVAPQVLDDVVLFLNAQRYRG
jgi:hypothetical protein